MSGPVVTRMLAVRKMMQDTHADDPDSIDDPGEVYGDSLDLFPAIEDHCLKSPHGQHVYGGLSDEVCIWCGERTGLDQ